MPGPRSDLERRVAAEDRAGKPLRAPSRRYDPSRNHRPHALVETPSGRLRIDAAARPLVAGEDVTFTVSGDRVQLSATPPSGDVNVIQAKVVGEEFVGATTTVHMEAADGTELKAQKSHAELAQIAIRTGQPVFVSWPVHQAHLLPAAA